MTDAERGVTEFVSLLDRCRAQVEDDPSGYLDNPHLYDAMHRVYLRLCHGNIPDFAGEPGDDEHDEGLEA